MGKTKSTKKSPVQKSGDSNEKKIKKMMKKMMRKMCKKVCKNQVDSSMPSDQQSNGMVPDVEQEDSFAIAEETHHPVEVDSSQDHNESMKQEQLSQDVETPSKKEKKKNKKKNKHEKTTEPMSNDNSVKDHVADENFLLNTSFKLNKSQKSQESFDECADQNDLPDAFPTNSGKKRKHQKNNKTTEASFDEVSFQDGPMKKGFGEDFSEKFGHGRKQSTFHQEQDFGQDRPDNDQVQTEESGTRVFITNLSPRSSEHTLRKFFEDKGLEVVDVFLPNNGKLVRFAFVEFSTHEEAQAAISMTNSEIDSALVSISAAKPRNKKQFAPRSFNTPIESTILCVHGLGETLKDDAAMNEMFSGAKDIRIPKSYDGEPRGKAFIEFNDGKTAKQTRDELLSKNIRVDYAQPRGHVPYFSRNTPGESEHASKPFFNKNRDFRSDRRPQQFHGRKSFNYGGERSQNFSGKRGRYFNNQSFKGRPHQDKAPRGTKVQFNNDDD